MSSLRKRIFLPAMVLLAFAGICASGSPGGSPRHADSSENETDSVAAMHAEAPTDSISQSDSLSVTSINPDDSLTNEAMAGKPGLSDRSTISRIVRDKVDLEDVVTFNSKDSLVMRKGNSAFMYGNSTVEYTDLKLNSGEIVMNMDSSLVFAKGVTDSLGNTDGKPVFSDRSGEYESMTMKYNFKTRRGFITDVVTEQGEGYLIGGATKKMDDGTFYVEDGRYTTCDNHDHPHFYFQLTKARVTPKKNIVTGPAYMVLADVPLPLAVPFGFFPFTKDYSSGIIFPTFGDDYNRGFYLRDGGYYFAINDNVDLALRGEIYTKGSWGVSGRSTYNKRYRFRGSIDISYITTITGDKGLADYAKQNNFRVAWTHSMDQKANPNMSFSASVDFTTSGYTRNDLNSYYDFNQFTQNTKSSTVNMTYRFPASKWSLSTTANITQRTQDSTLAVSFPNITLTMSQTQPFKRKKAAGAEKWYEKIRISYSGQFQNSLTAPQNQFFQKSLIKDWRNGMKHSLPVSATFSLFKYINVSPSIQLNDRMYTNKIRRQWDTQASREVQDTCYGFYNIFDFNASISLDTKLYGFWRPLKFLGNKLQMIRHVLTPTLSFSAAPDFSAGFWGYYGTYNYVDAQGNEQQRKYSYYSHGLFGAPGSGKSGIVSWNLANNLEMKIRDDSDSTGVKKVSLIENLSIGQSYNFAADSLRFSNINMSIMLRLLKNFNLSLSTTWDPYMYGLSPSGSPVKVNKLRIGHGKGIAKLSSTGTSFSYNFNNDTFKRKKKDDKNNTGAGPDEDADVDFPDGASDDPEGSDFAAEAERKRNQKKKRNENQSDADGYEPWAFPWNLSVNYSVSYGYGEFDYKKLDYKGKWTQNLSLSGSVRPTPGWNFSLSASYNFDLHKIAYMNCSISRDLHCFTMTCSFVPLGPYKSFNFHIGVKASLLKDLKWDKRSSTRNGITWY